MSAAEREFELDGRRYRAGRLSTMDQLAVASRWAGPCSMMAYARDNRLKGSTDAGFYKGISIGVAGSLGRLDEAARSDVSRLLLSVVTREDESTKRWAPLTEPGGQIMFADVQLAQLPLIFYNVVDHNGILDFFSVSQLTSADLRTAGTGSPSPAERAGS